LPSVAESPVLLERQSIFWLHREFGSREPPGPVWVLMTSVGAQFQRGPTKW